MSWAIGVVKKKKKFSNDFKLQKIVVSGEFLSIGNFCNHWIIDKSNLTVLESQKLRFFFFQIFIQFLISFKLFTFSKFEKKKNCFNHWTNELLNLIILESQKLGYFYFDKFDLSEFFSTKHVLRTKKSECIQQNRCAWLTRSL